MSTDAHDFTTTTDQIDGFIPGPTSYYGRHEDRAAEKPVDSQVLVDSRGARFAEAGHPAFPKPVRKKSHLVRRIITLGLIAAVIGAALYFGIPAVEWALSTDSTDDAFVSGHTTNTGPRVEGVVTEVLVEQNDRVEPGTLLVRIDREPYQIALAQSEASVEVARSQVDQAMAMVRSQLAGARASWFRRKNLQEGLRRQIKSLEAQVAALKARESSKNLAELDQRRLYNLVQKGSATQAELDQRNNTLDVATEQVKEAWAAIQETRASLGIGPNMENPLDIPKDLLENQSQIQNAVSDISSTLAQIGIPFDAHDIKPGEAFEQIVHMDTSQGLNDAFGHIIDQAPAVKVARSTLTRSERDLDNARLRLSWTEIRSEIGGYIQDRTVNPGNRVEPGQTLVSIRPDYVWVDANFKETQLDKIRIGMPVEMKVDAYPGRMFKARVAGFSPGTGLSESLLPPENATGNYIKVTQRLPVRLELTEPNPVDTPLFIGLSVVPYIKFKETPTGPGAGRRLHDPGYRQHEDVGGGPAGQQSRNRPEIERERGGKR